MELSTHVLDVERGTPGVGVRITVDDEPSAASVTGADGRARLPIDTAGKDRVVLRFALGEYLAESGRSGRFGDVLVEVITAEAGPSLHLPVLVSAFAVVIYQGT